MLDNPLSNYFRLTDKQLKILGERASIHARVIKTEAKKTFRKRIKIASANVSDGTGSLEITWFNQPYMASILKVGEDYTFTGVIKQNKRSGFSMQNPIFEKGSIEISDSGALIPIYPETRGLSSRWLRFAVKRIISK